MDDFDKALAEFNAELKRTDELVHALTRRAARARYDDTAARLAGVARHIDAAVDAL